MNSTYPFIYKNIKLCHSIPCKCDLIYFSVINNSYQSLVDIFKSVLSAQLVYMHYKNCYIHIILFNIYILQ